LAEGPAAGIQVWDGLPGGEGDPAMHDTTRAPAVEKAREYERVLVRTYRYLRLGMVGLVLLLAVGLVIERIRTGTILGSISAYYYTPVHSIFVASLCATGAILVVYRGYSDTEDVILNAAGFLAFVVALLPIRLGPQDVRRAETVLEVPRSTVLANLGALLVVTAASMVVTAWMLIRQDPATAPRTPRERTDHRRAITAFVALALGYVLVVRIYFANRDFLFTRGHWYAASGLLAAIVIVVAVNAVSRARRQSPDGVLRWRHLVNPYGLGFLVMILSTGLLLAIGEPGWDLLPNSTFWLEASLILQFGILWIIQTIEHWNDHSIIEELAATPPSEPARGSAVTSGGSRHD
jgi:uncharacterized membrane protein